MSDDDMDADDRSVSSVTRPHNANRQHTSGSLAQRFAYTLRPYHDDTEEQSKGGKARTQVRSLHHIPAVGFQYQQGQVGNYPVNEAAASYLPALALLRTPWKSRSHMGRNVNGPNGCAKYAEYVSNERKMQTFAEMYAVPFEIEKECDQPYDSKLLHFLYLTQAETHLFVPRYKEIRQVVFPQHVDDVTSSTIMHGHQGGLCGIADFTVFFMLRRGELGTSTQKSFLQFVHMLGFGLNMTYGGDSKVSAGINTEYCELYRSNKRFDSARVVTEANLGSQTTTMHYNMLEELDTVLWERLLDDIGRDNWKESITQCRRINNSLHGERLKEDDELPCEITSCGLFEMFMRVEMVAALDAEGNERAVKMDAVYLRSKAPGLDPLMALFNLTKSLSEAKNVVLPVLKHMSLILNGHPNVGIDDVFTVGSEKFDIVRLTHEGNLPLAVELFAHQQGWKLVSGLGNQKFDLHDKAKIDVYEEMLEITSKARRAHFKKIANEVQSDHKGSRQAAERPDSTYNIDGVVNFHYRSMSMSSLREQLEEIEKSLSILVNNEEARSMFQNEWEFWIDKQLKSGDGKWIYFPSAGGIINSGAVLHLDIESWSGLTADEQRNNLYYSKLLTQPTKAAPCIKLFLQGKRPKQNYSFIWEDPNILPTLQGMQKNLDELNVELVELMLAMNTNLSTEQLQKFSKEEQDDFEILQQWGLKSNPILNLLQLVQERTSPGKVAPIFHATFLSEVRRHIDELQNSQINHLELLGLTLADLVEQDEKYARQYQNNVREVMQKYQSSDPFLQEEAIAAFFVQHGTFSLDLKVSFCNEINTQAIQFAQIAIFGYMPKNRVYGYCVHISDGGRSFAVLATAAKSKKRDKIIINKKSSGTGGDLAKEQEVMRSGAYTSFVLENDQIRLAYQRDMSKDVTQKRTSEMALTELLGCGVKQDVRGKIEWHDSPFFDLAGNSAIFTELFKQQTDANLIKQAETLMGHSSRGEFLRETGWTTTKNMQQQNTSPTMVLPVTVICHNTNNLREETSMTEGGRIKSGLSGSLDSVGWIMPFKKVVSRGTIMRNDFSFDSLPMVKTPARIVTRDQARDHRTLMLIYFLTRRLPYLQRNLTLSVRTCHLGTTPFPHQIKMGALMATAGLRRYFVKNEDNFTRNFDGPYLTSTVFPMQFQTTISRSVIRACTHTTPQQTNMLQQSILQAVMALHDNTVSLLTMLASLYVWMFQSILDVKPMILSCYHLYFLDFKTPCPLEVLALAARDQEIPEHLMEKYSNFCAWIVDLVQQQNDFLMTSAAMEELTLQQASVYFDFENPDASQKIADITAKKHYGAVLTSYVCNKNMQCVKVKHKPALFKAKKERDDESVIDEHNSDIKLQIAELFGLHQDERVEHKEFWKAAADGARLPMDNFDSSDAKADAKHGPIYHTGTFYQDTTDQMMEGSGLVTLFLKMCGFGHQCSRADVFMAILKPYLKKTGKTCNLPRTAQWLSCILNVRGNNTAVVADPPFKFVVKPSKRRGQNPSYDGVNIFWAVDILWLVVSTIYASDWTGENVNSKGMLVHSRNVANASLAITNMMLHTHVNLSAIPTGKLLLQAPNPVHQGAYNCAELTIYPQIHVDSWISHKKPDEEGVRSKSSTRYGPTFYLSQRNRTHQHYEMKALLCDVGNAEEAAGGLDTVNIKFMLHRDLIDNTYHSITSQSDLLPYPREALCSMQNYISWMIRAGRSASRKSKIKDLFQEMQLYGSNFDIDNCEEDRIALQAVYPTITLKDAILGLPILVFRKELPEEYHCYMLGYLKASNDTLDEFVLKGVKPTHAVDNESIDTSCISMWDDMEVEYTVPLSEIAHLMVGGLKLRTFQDGSFVTEYYQNGEITKANPALSTLCCMPFPAIHWQQLVEIACDDYVLFTTEEEKVRVVYVAQWLYSLRDSMLNLDDEIDYFDNGTNSYRSGSWMSVRSETWIEPIKDSVFLISVDRYENGNKNPFSEETRFVVVLNAATFELAGSTAWPTTVEEIELLSGQFHYVVFNNEAHLKHILRENNGAILSQEDCNDWKWPKFAAMQTLCTNSHNMESYNLFRIHEKGGKLQSPVTRYLPPDEEQLRHNVTQTKSRFQESEKQLKSEMRAKEMKLQQDPEKNVSHHDKEIDRLTSQISLLRESLDRKQKALRDAHTVFRVIRARVFQNDEMERLLNPIDVSDLTRSLGLTKSFKQDQYFCDGHNQVKAKIDCSEIMQRFDFGSISRCIVPEGSPLYILINEERLDNLSVLFPNYAINCDKDNFMKTDSSSDNILCLLRGFYVLGADHDAFQDADDSLQALADSVRVILMFKNADGKIVNTIVSVCLWDEETNLNICTERQRKDWYGDVPIAAELVQTNKRRQVSAQERPNIYKDVWSLR